MLVMSDNVVGIPTVTAAQMARIDRIMMDDLAVDPLQLMEAAGLAVTEAIRQQLGGDVGGKRVLLLAGSGGNGGDALVAARHLQSCGAHPHVLLSKPEAELPPVTAHQANLARNFQVPVREAVAGTHNIESGRYDLIVDGLLGFSAKGDPRGLIAELIQRANAHSAPILAIDLPSGLDATSGAPGDPCIQAASTITLALPKQGFMRSEARKCCGDITVADIGVPATVVARVGVSVPFTLFAKHSSLRWRPEHEQR